ncbi:MAG: hypothetical protein MRQ11_00790 [Candidatus Midichloria mitochondrii]|nr:hypothetical protein [Candidatus Midichloria mitochondrii]
MPNPAHHGIARRTISWQTSFSGLLAYVFKPNIYHGKIGSQAYSLRQTEVILFCAGYLTCHQLSLLLYLCTFTVPNKGNTGRVW